MKLAAVGIISKNILESLNFYNFFNLNFEASSNEHYECQLQSGLRIMIDSYELAKKLNPSFEMPVQSHISLCFEQESPQKVDELVKKLKSKGYIIKKDPWDAFWGQRYAIVLDPDGTQVDIFSTLV